MRYRSPRSSTVHPRACGEQGHRRRVGERSSPGSSPRLRGTAASRCGSAGGAGNPYRAPVHPRACGEQSIQVIALLMSGSSPRLRGTVAASIPRECSNGSSPRLRGTAQQPLSRSVSHPVHPRACGEQILGILKPGAGSSPRLRGTDGSHAVSAGASQAVHPRACGEQLHWQSGTVHPRACLRSSVHPRACGEQDDPDQRGCRRFSVGSSPRLRGTQ